MSIHQELLQEYQLKYTAFSPKVKTAIEEYAQLDKLVQDANMGDAAKVNTVYYNTTRVLSDVGYEFLKDQNFSKDFGFDSLLELFVDQNTQYFFAKQENEIFGSKVYSIYNKFNKFYNIPKEIYDGVDLPDLEVATFPKKTKSADFDLSEAQGLLDEADGNIVALMLQELEENEGDLSKFVDKDNCEVYREYYNVIVKRFDELKDGNPISKEVKKIYQYEFSLVKWDLSLFIGAYDLHSIKISKENESHTFSFEMNHTTKTLIPISYEWNENGKIERSWIRYQDYSTCEEVSDETTKGINDVFYDWLGGKLHKFSDLDKEDDNDDDDICAPYKKIYKKLEELASPYEFSDLIGQVAMVNLTTREGKQRTVEFALGKSQINIEYTVNKSNLIFLFEYNDSLKIAKPIGFIFRNNGDIESNLFVKYKNNESCEFKNKEDEIKYPELIEEINTFLLNKFSKDKDESSTPRYALDFNRLSPAKKTKWEKDKTRKWRIDGVLVSLEELVDSPKLLGVFSQEVKRNRYQYGLKWQGASREYNLKTQKYIHDAIIKL